MTVINKSYIYKIYNNGTYLGNLPMPSNDFNYSQDINSAGSQITLSIPLSVDTSEQTPPYLTTEDGKIITTEDGKYIVLDRQPDTIGSSNPNNLIQNGNDIKVYEYSSTYPNGKLMFVGYISSWQANFGGDDDDQVTITCLSNGTELNNILIPGTGSYVVDQSFTTDNGTQSYDVFPPRTSFVFGQYFKVGAGIQNLAAMSFNVRVSSDPAILTLKIWNTQNTFFSGLPLATGTVTISNTVFSENQITLPVPLDVTPGQEIFWTLETNNLNTQIRINDVRNAYANSNTVEYTANDPIFPSKTWQTYGGTVWFKSFYSISTTQISFSDEDPVIILGSILDSYVSQSGNLVKDSYDLSGISSSPSFNINTILEGIQQLITLVPSDWYWYADVATQVIAFRQTSSTADFTLVKGKHLTSLQLKTTIDQLKNVVYFSGGNDGSGNNLFIKYSDNSSINSNNGRVGLDRISNSNITNASDGTLIAQNDADGNNAEIYQTQVTILDGTMDITLPRVGDVVGFSGFGMFVDDLLLQIVRLDYTPEKLTLSLGKIPPRINADVQQLKNSINSLQTIANPDSPS